MSEMRRRVERQDRASRFLASVETSPTLLTDLLEIAAAAAVALGPDQHDAHRHGAQGALDRAKADLQGIARGHLEVGPGDGGALLFGLQAARKYIWAASVFPRQLGFWESSSGAFYLHAQQNLTENKVTIMRVFIVDKAVR